MSCLAQNKQVCQSFLSNWLKVLIEFTIPYNVKKVGIVLIVGTGFFENAVLFGNKTATALHICKNVKNMYFNLPVGNGSL